MDKKIFKNLPYSQNLFNVLLSDLLRKTRISSVWLHFRNQEFFCDLVPLVMTGSTCRQKFQCRHVKIFCFVNHNAVHF